MPALPAIGEGRSADLALTIRETSRCLVALDNEMNGLPIADVAARSFKKVHRLLGEGGYDRKSEREIQAAAAELAEISGWALFNEGKFSSSRRFSHEALFLAKLAGDRSIELITLQNMGMLAGWSGRPCEELAIAQSVIDQGSFSPRVEAMFRAREAQGLAASGRTTEADRSFDRARSLLLECVPNDEPYSAWWIFGQEMDRQQGRAMHKARDWRQEIPVLERAMHQQEGSRVGYQNVAAVRLLDSLLRVKAWKAAEIEAENLVPVVGEMPSVVSLRILENVVKLGKLSSEAPSTLRDILHHIESAIEEDLYEI